MEAKLSAEKAKQERNAKLLAEKKLIEEQERKKQLEAEQREREILAAK